MTETMYLCGPQVEEPLDPDGVYVWECARGHEVAVSELMIRRSVFEPDNFPCSILMLHDTARPFQAVMDDRFPQIALDRPTRRAICGARLVRRMRKYPAAREGE